MLHRFFASTIWFLIFLNLRAIKKHRTLSEIDLLSWYVTFSGRSSSVYWWFVTGSEPIHGLIFELEAISYYLPRVYIYNYIYIHIHIHIHNYVYVNYMYIYIYTHTYGYSRGHFALIGIYFISWFQALSLDTLW